MPDDAAAEAFTGYFGETQPRLGQSLITAYGGEGRAGCHLRCHGLGLGELVAASHHGQFRPLPVLVDTSIQLRHHRRADLVLQPYERSVRMISKACGRRRSASGVPVSLQGWHRHTRRVPCAA